MEYDSPALRLHREKPRIFWGKVIHTLIQQGWNPPTPDMRVTEDIIQAIERVMENSSEALLNPDAMLKRKYDTRLTPQEARILANAADGLNNNEIAERMGIASQTVKFHMTSIMKKMPARSRTHAVVIAMRDGVLS